MAHVVDRHAFQRARRPRYQRLFRVQGDLAAFGYHLAANLPGALGQHQRVTRLVEHVDVRVVQIEGRLCQVHHRLQHLVWVLDGGNLGGNLCHRRQLARTLGEHILKPAALGDVLVHTAGLDHSSSIIELYGDHYIHVSHPAVCVKATVLDVLGEIWIHGLACTPGPLYHEVQVIRMHEFTILFRRQVIAALCLGASVQYGVEVIIEGEQHRVQIELPVAHVRQAQRA